jgi:CDGSH-type Zn-finger protein
MENGPYVVRGDFTVAGAPQLRATLCRCGKSKNKPFCDHSHVDGFEATGECATREPQPWPDGDAPTVAVDLAVNGPLLITGAVEVIAASGRTIDRGAKFALCRCGQSGNKPFCDGTHRKVGFTG